MGQVGIGLTVPCKIMLSRRSKQVDRPNCGH